MQTPFFPTEHFRDPDQALARVAAIHQAGLEHLRACLKALAQGRDPGQRQRACYPFVRIEARSATRGDARLAYGFLAGIGMHETTLTRPALFASYYREQFALLLANHDAPLQVGVSQVPIPLHFALDDQAHLEAGLTPAMRAALREHFDMPDLAMMDDRIANGTHERAAGQPHPLALFTAPRVDFSLHRLRHYCGSAPEDFQKFVLFTNYAFYIDEFVRLGREWAAAGGNGWSAFIEPVTPSGRLPQMPAWHLQRADGRGITMINIGVGPANAKTITDHLAVLRPDAWVMLGHCAGLRNSQRLGDYVLAHGYLREDHVLDEDLPPWVPVPALAEIQQALEQAVASVTQLSGLELKRVMRTGTVASTDNRNWELLSPEGPIRRYSQSRAIALDMESATIAANGFRFRVPYGTLLCVSDRPLHGDIKLPGMADSFYGERVDQHLRIGVQAMELLRAMPPYQLHSRKLRSFAEVAFQ